MGRTTRWAAEFGPQQSQQYVHRLRQMAADGADLTGEARLLDTILPRGSRILDAGCGAGRVGAALAQRGHVVVGVDADPVLVAAARSDHPNVIWLLGDLVDLDLAAAGQAEPFDAAVVAGHVMAYLAPGTERAVLVRLARQIRPDGVIVVGFGTDRGYPLTDFDEDLSAAGLRLEHRFATWDLRRSRSAAHTTSPIHTAAVASG